LVWESTSVWTEELQVEGTEARDAILPFLSVYDTVKVVTSTTFSTFRQFSEKLSLYTYFLFQNMEYVYLQLKSLKYYLKLVRNS